MHQKTVEDTRPKQRSKGTRLVISHYISFMTLFYFIIILLFIMFLVCSSCIFDIVIVDDEFMHMFVEHLIQFSRELGGTYYEAWCLDIIYL
jgi:hypothetical protein